VLRVVADEAVRSFPKLEYFPSYEIITGPYARGRYYGDDLREIEPAGVKHAMRIFLAHYPQGAAAAAICSGRDCRPGSHQGREGTSPGARRHRV